MPLENQVSLNHGNTEQVYSRKKGKLVLGLNSQ